MLLLVKFFGIVNVGIGAILLLAPAVIEPVLVFMQQGNRPYAGVVLRLAMGTVLVAAARQCQLPGAVRTLGILVLASGLVGLLVGADAMRSPMQWGQERWSPALTRVAAVVPAAFGAFLLFAARPEGPTA